jgi:hemerythrin-like domain-containing protein
MSFIQAKPLATHDFYGPVHKGLRLAQTQMLVRLGACGGDDAQELNALLEDLTTLLHMAEHHLANEDRWVHSAMEARAPGSTLRLAQSHQHHRDGFEEMEALIGEAATADTEAQRAKLMRQLYLRFSLFVADDFAHMAEEEQLMLPVLQSLFTDEELAGIEDTILSALSPPEIISFGRLMIPAATRAGRIALLSAMRANAPAEAFAAIMELSARPTLSAGDYAHLEAGLGLAA